MQPTSQSQVKCVLWVTRSSEARVAAPIQFYNILIGIDNVKNKISMKCLLKVVHVAAPVSFYGEMQFAYKIFWRQKNAVMKKITRFLIK